LGGTNGSAGGGGSAIGPAGVSPGRVGDVDVGCGKALEANGFGASAEESVNRVAAATPASTTIVLA
jgi:hypothetical protein